MFAYKLADGSTRPSDGEPGGNWSRCSRRSGLGLVDVVALVIRYYGGIKLGTGDIVRAYGGAAKQCLELGETREVRTEAYIISYVHGDTGSVFGLIGGLADADLERRQRRERADHAAARRARGPEQRLAEATAGRASIAG